MSDEPETTKCLLCNRVLRPDETQTCRRCVERLDETLEAVVELYALLPSVLLPGSVLDDMPHGKRVDAPAPVRLDVLDALDERPGYSKATGALSGLHGIVGVLGEWGRLVREERNFAAPTEPITVVTEIGFLRKQLPWITEQPWLDEFEREVKDLHRSLRQVTGDSGPKPIGACPAEFTDDGQVKTCGATLYAPLNGDVVRCRRCRSQWPRERWLILGAIIAEGEAS